MGNMRIAMGQLSHPEPSTLKLIKQLGVNSIQFNTPALPGKEKWEYEDLLDLRKQCEDYGLTLEAVENVPLKFYYKAILGLPGKDQQIENYREIIRNVGRAGIPVLGYHFMPNFVWRTSFAAPGRGGAKVSAFSLQAARKEGNKLPLTEFFGNKEMVDYDIESIKNISEEEMWSNYKYFIKAVLPAAEAAGVKLALHPDDPPLPVVGGVTRLFYKPENFKKAMAIADSDAWGLDLCLGCCSEMQEGADSVFEMIDYFGSSGKILYIHFRDVQGTIPEFQECFLGEGNFDPAQVIRQLKQVDFSGFLIADHVPEIEDDTDWGHRARAHAVGYMQGLLKML